MIVAPDGRVLAKAPVGKDSVMTIDIDPRESENEQITPRNHLFRDRQSKFYE